MFYVCSQQGDILHPPPPPQKKERRKKEEYRDPLKVAAGSPMDPLRIMYMKSKPIEENDAQNTYTNTKENNVHEKKEYTCARK